MSVENLVGCRKALAGAFASAVMIAMSTSGAMAVVGCAGTAGTSGFTSNPAQFNLQCMQPIILPTTLQPLQSFGGSEVVRTNATTAFYYLADRTNLGIIVINATNMTYMNDHEADGDGYEHADNKFDRRHNRVQWQGPDRRVHRRVDIYGGPFQPGYAAESAPWKRSIPARMGWRSTKIPVTRMTSDGCLSPMAPAKSTTTEAAIRALRLAVACVPAARLRIHPSPGPLRMRIGFLRHPALTGPVTPYGSTRCDKLRFPA